MLHPILKSQNDSHHIRLLKASTVAYTRAKSWEIIITYVLIILAFAYPVTYVITKNEGFKLGLFICSFLLTVVVQLFMDVFKGNTSKGAIYKEAFDVSLFNLPWKTTLTPPNDDEIHELAQLYKGNDIRDWYSTQLSPAIPDHTAVAILQYSNTSWDILLRKKYMVLLIRFVCIYSIGLGIFLLIRQVNPRTTFLLLFSVLSFYTHFISLIRAHKAVINRREYISGILNNLIRQKKEISTQELRDIQDEIYITRQEATKVPNFFFRWHQKEMNDAAENYIHEINILYQTSASPPVTMDKGAL